LHGRRKKEYAGQTGQLSDGSDASVDLDQGQEHQGRISAGQLAANTETPRNSDERQRAACSPTSDELLVAGRRSSRARNSSEQPGSYHVRNGSYGSTSLGGTVESGSADATTDSVSTVLERWKAAISMTTMQMMERRMAQSLHATSIHSQSGSRQSPADSIACQQQAAGAPAGAAAAAAGVAKKLFGVSGHPIGLARADSAGRATALGAGMGRSNSSSGAEAVAQAQQPLRLQMLIGQGSFGSVYLGTW
jgi:hypothetical protein